MIDAKYWIRRSEVDAAMVQRLRQELTIPARFEDDTPFVALDESFDDRLGLPRAWAQGRRSSLPPPLPLAEETGEKDEETEETEEKKDEDGATEHATKHKSARFTQDLRPYQVRAVKDMCQRLRNPGCVGGLLEARPGTGKTVMALNMACTLGARTLVIVNRGLLLDQWKERVQQFTDAGSVGEICQDRCNVDAPIVVGMMQSLACRAYPPAALAGFDLVVVDEVHRICAQVMSKSLCMPARWYLGLSATMERTDGRHAFLAWTFGRDRVLVATDTQTVRVLRYPIESSGYVTRRIENLRPGLTTIQRHAQIISILARCTLRLNQLAVAAAEQLEAGRWVLLVSDRVKQLEDLADRLGRLGYARGDALQVLTGKTKARDRAIQPATRVVLATTTLVKEGWDGVPHFDTLLVCSPVSNEVVLRQLHGRIMRPPPGKAMPLIVDVCDTADAGGATKRRRMYARVSQDRTAGLHYQIEEGEGV